MLLYLILLCLVVSSSAIVSFERNKKIAYVFKIVTCLLIAVPAAIRYGIGVDYWSYIDMYKDIARHGLGVTEIGFNLLNLWVARCEGSAQWVIAIMAFATVYFSFKGVQSKRWIIYAPLFLLLIYNWYFTSIRQIFAASLVFYSWRLFLNRKKIAGIIALTCSFLFHYSTIIYPIIYWVCRYIHFNRIIAFSIFITVLIISYKYSTILFEPFLWLTGLSEHYENYAYTKWALENDNGSGWGNLTNYTTFALLLFCYPNQGNLKKRGYFTLLLIYVCLVTISSQITIISRLARGIVFFLLPIIWDVVVTKTKYRIIWIILIFFLLLSFYMARIIGDPNLVPYQTIFDN